VGYLVTYLSQRGAVTGRLRAINAVADLLGGDPVPIWKAVGRLFYNAHFVPTTVPGLGGPQTENFVAGGPTLLYLVAPLALLAAGALAARAAGPEPWLAGGLVFAGYLPLAVLGAIGFGYGVGDGAVAPDLVAAVLLAGVVYPVAFGAVGGLVGDRLATD
jgi:hypothetical protein